MKKFKNWLWFNPPITNTFGGWSKFYSNFKQRAPVRYFIAHVFFPFLRRIRMRLRDAVWFVRHRTTDKYHLVDTRLKPGYYDVDDRLLHSCFSLLCQYVENSRDKLKFSVTLRDPSSDGYDPIFDPNSDKFFHHQAVHAEEALRLYEWWTEERGKELKALEQEVNYCYDLMLEKAGNDFCKVHSEEFEIDHSGIVKKYKTAVLHLSVKEDEMRNLDNEMLKRLIDIRSSLW